MYKLLQNGLVATQETSLESYLDTLQHAIARADTHLSDPVHIQSRETHVAHVPLSASETTLRTQQTRLSALSDGEAGTAAPANTTIAPARPLYHFLANKTAVHAALHALVRLDEGVAVLEAAASSRSLMSPKRRSRTSIEPWVGASRPAKSESSVDFPLPEGPTSATL